MGSFKLDYNLISGLEEWKDGKYKITKDFYRLVVFTDKMRGFLKEKTGKDVPLAAKIKLDKSEMIELHNLISSAYEFCGTYGSYRARAFDLDCFYIGDKDGLATEDELAYDYTWKEL